MALKCSSAVKQKLAQKHGVSLEEVQQYFANREGNLLEDIREEHKTDPPTQWFIAETDYGRRLKVAFMLKGDDIIIIKTSYEPNQTEDGIYRKFG